MDLALNNLKSLICHKTQTTNQPTDAMSPFIFSMASDATQVPGRASANLDRGGSCWRLGVWQQDSG